MQNVESGLKFAIGAVVMTVGVSELISSWGLDKFIQCLRRHACGDWGDLDEFAKAQNDKAVANGGLILSCYTPLLSTTLWIITEADRSVTTLLLPSEY